MIAKCESNYPKPKPCAKTRPCPIMMKILAMFFPLVLAALMNMQTTRKII
jgi:hypothetical protein